MKARHIILTIAAVMILAAPTAVLAQMGPGPGDGSGPGGGWGGGPGPHGGGPGRFGDPEGAGGLRFFEHMLPRLADELGLSDEQLTEIQAIVDAAQLKIDEKGWIEELEAAREAYRTNHENSTVFDEDAFREHAAAQHLIQTEIGVVVGQARADALSVLTAEQLAQLEEMRANFGGKSFRRGDRRRSSS
jgi:Spy/CpxP family protein refolding chaperone